MLKSTLEQWRMLKAVVDHGGFSQAAEAVHKSQSTVHHAVHKLEELLGVKLLQVNGRKAELTEAGEMMLRRASYVLQEARKLEVIANNLSKGVESRLKIAVDEAFPQCHVYHALNEVSQRYPHTRVEIYETILSGAHELISSGKVDIGISGFLLSVGSNEQLCAAPFVALAHPAHPLHQLGTLSFEDLKSYRQIVVRDSSATQSRDSGWLGAEQRWTVSNLRTSIDLISKGFGFAWLPQSEAQQAIDAGLLKPLTLEHGAVRTENFYLNIKDSDQLGPAGKTFVDQLKASVEASTSV